nr:alpha-amylase family glycosyl hydrolase [Acidobacteriota bacterium]
MPVSHRAGMGANAYDGGVTFRVWAPFAARVAVAGSWNGWSTDADPLASEGGGYWSADVAGAKVADQYKFFLVNREHGGELWKNDPYARSLTSSVGNSVVAETDFEWSAIPYQTPPWDEWVIYELHVGSFLFDPAAPGRSGTFRTVIEKLDYLRDLGINVIEIMAAGEFPWDHSWGYNQSYMFAIEHLYGGPNGFRALVDQAHCRGIAVVFDVVYNHIGPNDLDLWQFDGWSEDGHGGIYFYNDWRRQTPWGDTRPDYGRPEVREYLRDNALRWIEQRQVDGLRWDATGWIRNVFGKNDDPAHDIPDGWSLMQWINDEIHSRQPWKMSIAEDMQDNERLTRPTSAQGAGFDAQWSAGFVHPVRAAIVAGDDSGRDMNAVAGAIAQRFSGNALARVIYTESHDEDANGHSRVPEEIWPGNAGSLLSRKRSTLGAALVFTSPGIPMIFQGQEFLEDRYFRDSVELDWAKAERHSGIVSLYRDLIRLRRNGLGNSRGLRGQHLHVHQVNDRDKLIAFHRWDQGGPGDDVVVVVNMANRAYDSYRIGMPREGLWQVRFNSDWSGYSPDFGNHPSFAACATPDPHDQMPCAANVGIGPY